MADNRFELAVYDPDSQLVSVRHYLAERAAGRADWLPGWDGSSFFLVVDGQERVGDAWNLAALDVMVAQLDAARARLEEGRDALVRSAVEDQMQPPFFLFEVDGETVKLSEFHIAEMPYASEFPIPPASPKAMQLYDYVAKERERLLQNLLADNFARLPYPRAQLVAELRREVEAGRQLLALLEVPPSPILCLRP